MPPSFAQVVVEGGALSSDFLKNIAACGFFDEIPNAQGAVRNYIFNRSRRDKVTGLTDDAVVFAVYQTGRYGPQNGFRFVVVHRGYPIAAKEKAEGEPEDEIDAIEKPIPQGHLEVVILGTRKPIPDPVQSEAVDEEGGDEDESAEK